MSLFDSQFDIESVVAGKQFATEFDLNKNSQQFSNLNYASPYYGSEAVHTNVIPASEFDIYNDLLELPEDSMNLEEMIGETNNYMADFQTQQQPQQPQQGSNKREYDVDDYNSQASACLPRTLTNDYSSMASPYQQNSPAGRSTASSSSRCKSSSTKNIDKDSEEYRRRRQLNNVAVKKSREKAKQEARQTVQRLNLLSADKERLERRVEQLTKELQFLHGVFTKFADIPEPVRSEMARAFSRLQIHNSR